MSEPATHAATISVDQLVASSRVVFDRVERGERITLTRRGKRVAVLLSGAEYDEMSAAMVRISGTVVALQRELAGYREAFATNDVVEEDR